MLCAFGQPNADQVQSRIEGTSRTQSSLPSQTANSPSTAVADTAESDTGAQRPCLVNRRRNISILWL